MRSLLLRTIAPASALAAAAVLLMPAKESYGFSKIGGSLNVSTQRDMRVFNNFADSTANNNFTQNPMFPGWFGADRALWKAAVEWGSLPHGDGSGDPNQPVVGDGSANFDFFFGGAATGSGGVNANIASAITGSPGCGGGTLAYVLSPISNGWTARFCENRIWSDGPSGPGGGRFDLQGVGCHEFGHALGLGHSGSFSATMFGSTPNGLAQRSLAADDIAGIQCIYGVRNPLKPVINNARFDPIQNVVVIDGTNFGDVDNEVWFTHAFARGTGFTPFVRVTGVTSSAGGTQIVVSVPPEAGSGDVAVRDTQEIGGKSLSNAYPIDLGRGGGVLPLAILGVNPPTVEALVPGTAQTVTVQGTGFDATVVLTINGVVLPTQSYTVVDEFSITVDMPQLTSIGQQTIGVQKGTESSTAPFAVLAPADPTLQMGTGDPLNVVSGTVELLIAGPPNEIEIVLYGISDLPSSLPPLVELDIGNGFTELQFLQVYTIPASGWTQETIPVPSVPIEYYVQAVTFDRGAPIPVSNLQSISVIP